MLRIGRGASCRVIAPIALLIFMLASSIGCNSPSGIEEVAVSGSVSYEGIPLEDGEIRFVPIKGTKGPANLGYIKQGNYSVTARGGVPVGTHRVEIRSYKPNPKAKPYTEEQADGEFGIKAGDLPNEQYIPDKYNKHSTLEATIESNNGSQKMDFNLE